MNMLGFFLLVAFIGLVLLLVVGRMIFRARLPKLPFKVPTWADFRGGNANWPDVKGLLSRLKARSNTRYGVPWIMVIGEPGSGHSGVVGAAVKGQNVRLLQRNTGAKLKSPMLKVHDRGLLLDMELSSKTDWRSALVDLLNWRSERPLDSLILMISAKSLMDANPGRINALVRQLYYQLWSLQKHLEFIIPIYLLITDADEVPGFRAFWQYQEEYHGQLFGWSSPYGLEARFKPEWVGTAMDAIQQQLYRLQSQAMAAGKKVEDADDFVLFPKTLARLKTNLTKLSGILFHETVYETGASVRGLYLCGRITADADPVFLKDLIDKKIYPERNQARPLRQGALSRNTLIRRLQWGTQALFAVLFLSLFVTSSQLKGDIQTQTKAMNEMRTLVNQRGSAESNGEVGMSCLTSDQFYSLVRYIGEIKAAQWYWNLPPSYPIFNAHGPAELSSRFLADQVMENMVLPTLKCTLEARYRTVAHQWPLSLSEPIELAEQRWTTLMQNLTDLGRQTANFKRISQPPAVISADNEEGIRTMAAFAELIEYLFEEPLSKTYLGQDRALYHALLQVDFTEHDTLRKPLNFDERLATLVPALTSELRNLHLKRSQEGMAILDNLVGDQAARSETRVFRDWHNYVLNTWLHSTYTQNHCEELSTRLQPVVKLWPLPGSSEWATELDMAHCYQPVLANLSIVSWAGQSIVQRDQGRLNWSDEFEFELQAIKKLAELDFMAIEADGKLDCDARLLATWNHPPVDAAVHHLSEYQTYLDEQAQAAIEAGQVDNDPLYVKLGNRQMRHLINNSIGRAMMIPDQPVLKQQELANQSYAFKRALDSLVVLNGLFDQVLGSEVDDVWQGCVDLYATEHLAVLQSLSADAFQLATGPVTEVEPNPLFPSLKDAPTIAAYFQDQIDRVQWLADLAAPYSQWLGAPVSGTDNRPARFWHSTLSELRRLLILKDPKSDAQLLNDFLNQTVASLTYDNCREQVATLSTSSSAINLFAQRQVELARQARQACDNRIDLQARRNYLALYRDYNAKLAGRFPFADLDAPDASPADVQQVFDTYSKVRPTLITWADTQSESVKQFIADLDETQTLMGYLIQEGETRPLNLSFQYRVAAAGSPGSEQVVRWTLSNDIEEVFYPNGGSQLNWQSGEAMSISLDWARRSPFVPRVDSTQPTLTVNNRVASFRQDGDWALLRWVRQHRDSAFPVSNRLTLRFQVPVTTTSPTDTMAGDASSSTSVLRLGVGFQHQDSQSQQWVPLLWPKSFPRQAPGLI